MFLNSVLMLSCFGFIFGIDPYDVLNVRKGANEKEVRRAFREMALRFHPDKRPEDPQYFLKIKEAYNKILENGPRMENVKKELRSRRIPGAPAAVIATALIYGIVGMTTQQLMNNAGYKREISGNSFTHGVYFYQFFSIIKF